MHRRVGFCYVQGFIRVEYTLRVARSELTGGVALWIEEMFDSWNVVWDYDKRRLTGNSSIEKLMWVEGMGNLTLGIFKFIFTNGTEYIYK